MSDAAAAEARRALARLGRALGKAERELSAVEGALRHAEGDDFPASRYDEARDRLRALHDLIEEESARLQEKVLMSGGLEPGRVRRSG